MDKQHKYIQDVLPVGKHKIKVCPKREWDDQKRDWIDGTIKHGKGQHGEWWLYQTLVGEGEKKEYISIFANAKNKSFFDSGEVECVIKPLINKYSKKPEVDENGKPVIRAYFNEVVKEKGEASETPVFDQLDGTAEDGLIEDTPF